MSSGDVERKMARGALWLMLLTFTDRALGLVSTLILARLLLPADFGIVAMAYSFIFLAQLIAAFGFDVALIHKQDAGEAHYHSAWTLNLLLGATIFLIVLCAAEPIARFYAQPNVFWVVCALALGPLLGGFENIGVVAFRKDLDFRKEFMFQISRRFVGFAVTLPLAFLLQSYWALVAGTLAARLAGTITSYTIHPFRPRLSLAEAPSLLHFSKWLLLNNVLGLLKERMSDFAIGRLAGPAALGIYNITYEFSNLPTSEIGAPINRAMLPGFARLADADAVRSTYMSAMGILALFAIPAATGIFAVAHFFVPVVLGTKWLAGVPLMEVLSISSAFLMFQASICSVLIGRGFPGSVTRINACFVVLLAALLLVLAPRFQGMGAACAALSTTVLTTPIYLYALRSHLSIPIRTFFICTFRPALAAVVMALVVRMILPDYSSVMSTLNAAFWLITGVVTGAVTYVVSIVLLWLAAGKPPGAEHIVISRVLGKLAHILGSRRTAALRSQQ